MKVSKVMSIYLLTAWKGKNHSQSLILKSLNNLFKIAGLPCCDSNENVTSSKIHESFQRKRCHQTASVRLNSSIQKHRGSNRSTSSISTRLKHLLKIGVKPPKSSCIKKLGFGTIIFTIHFGGFTTPYFWKKPFLVYDFFLHTRSQETWYFLSFVNLYQAWYFDMVKSINWVNPRVSPKGLRIDGKFGSLKFL